MDAQVEVLADHDKLHIDIFTLHDHGIFPRGRHGRKMTAELEHIDTPTRKKGGKALKKALKRLHRIAGGEDLVIVLRSAVKPHK